MEVVMTTHETIHVHGGRDIKAWIEGVPLEDQARKQLENIARLPIVHPHVAVMPDVHLGMGATIGSVIPTRHAIVPAAVGVDVGCGMMAVRTDMQAKRLPDNLKKLRTAIEKAVPHGRTKGGRKYDRGAWGGRVPDHVDAKWLELFDDFDRICTKHRAIRKTNNRVHLGTLGTGNHFVEVCLDEEDRVWFMLHSGSRGVGNRIGSYFIGLAREDMGAQVANLPDRDLAYFHEGTQHFDDYVEAVGWAQRYARINREIMMAATLKAAAKELGYRFKKTDEAVNCHHNYVQKEEHYGESVWLTRKGAVSAKAGQLGIIPGSMGAKSFIVRGKGNAPSFHSCSHGAGRAMSRGAARRRFTQADHRRMTEGVECRKDAAVIDETPAAYKDIEAVMKAQSELVEVVHTLRQVVCVKG
ncbi:MAG: RtcB family protein [Proteobacteria bacterium]|nr:RtcB family protein [Pseudomonadota bacterium]MCP4915695.1 RtcB family protein [Pseudomonadota bacterium]